MRHWRTSLADYVTPREHSSSQYCFLHPLSMLRRFPHHEPFPSMMPRVMLVCALAILLCQSNAFLSPVTFERRSEAFSRWIPCLSAEEEASEDMVDGSRRELFMAAGLATSLIAQAGWCLDDLPPIPKDYVRLYLCRHGQTENNRLGLIQGARVDPPLNERGRLQAERLGKAWESMDLVLHSPLRRARETATIASQQLASQPKLEQLPSLAEVDFGSVLEGSPVEKHRAAMVRTYGAWAVGDLDARLDDGESGYEVRLLPTLVILTRSDESR